MKLKALKTWNSIGFAETCKAGDVFEAASPSRARQLVADGRAEEIKPQKRTKTKKSDS